MMIIQLLLNINLQDSCSIVLHCDGLQIISACNCVCYACVSTHRMCTMYRVHVYVACIVCTHVRVCVCMRMGVIYAKYIFPPTFLNYASNQ